MTPNTDLIAINKDLTLLNLLLQDRFDLPAERLVVHQKLSLRIKGLRQQVGRLTDALQAHKSFINREGYYHECIQIQELLDEIKSL